MSFGESITNIRKHRGISRKDFAEQLQIPYTTLRNYETGQREPGHNLLIKMAEELHVSVDELIGYRPKYEEAPSCSGEAMRLAQDYDDKMDDWGRKQVRDVADNEIARCSADRQAKAAAVREERERASRETSAEIEPEERKVIDLRHHWLKASAGTGYQLDDERMDTWVVELNDLTRRADFCVDVDGDSMEPKYYNGDIILVRQQPAVDIGEIGLFTVGDKGYVKKQGGDRLISINPKREDIFPNDYEIFFCRGKVIGVLDPKWIVER